MARSQLPDRTMDDLQQEFIAETHETLEALSGELVAWEAEPDHGEHLDSIFRFFHTVKGSAGFLSLPRFEKLAHEAEDVLARLRESERPITSQLVSAILALVDHIAELTAALESGAGVDHAQDGLLIEALTKAWEATLELTDDAAMDKVASAYGAPADDQNRDQPTLPESGSDQKARTVRLPLALLDQMMNSVSDMVLARNEVARQLRELQGTGELDAAFERLSTCVGDLRDSIGRTRMQRMEGVFAPLPRIVRDLAADLGKKVDIVCTGQDVELDREMIEMIRDPLVHIIRNALDHGIETPSERERAGKVATGKLEINASQSGNQILITIEDDGAGIDTAHLGEKAVAARIHSRSQIHAMSEAALVNLIFAPGISTADQVTAISGRGVGMDVVRANIERVGGAIDLHNSPGKGLKIVIRVPLTLTIIACLILQCGGHQFALPQSAVREITSAANDQIRIDPIGDGCIAALRDDYLPVVRLGDVLHIEASGAQSGAGDDLGNKVIIVIDVHGGARFALMVDGVTDHEDLVIRPGAPALIASGLYAGTTLPDNGRPMLLIDPAGVARSAGIEALTKPIKAPIAEATEQSEQRNAVETPISLLVFHDCEQRKRALVLDCIERVEDFPVDALAFSAGQLRLTRGDRTYPVLGIDRPPEGQQIKLLQLTDGSATLFYAIGDIADIHHTTKEALSAGALPQDSQNPVSAISIAGGAQVEVLDSHWLFSEVSDYAMPINEGARPLCLLADADDGWSRRMLEPLLTSAGYAVSYDAQAADRADVIISNVGGPAFGDARNVIHLRQNPEAEPGRDSIYRYDRVGLIGALQAKRQERRHG
ncbi:chemotaxis protein CheA [Alterisphingorhabdus coralli]|uniref:Chemotaxis protein CheA n=1 Tax=Alterisphingorhabdus coralli TaxID=3071408 RepID=A0AA97I2J1_9SPHN|nr:chemotaxis protein CheA [Parasphingorhabdus sp. SCSIO 66989]WOE76455.1 chemotaxis protein CheA [Parasphingorhabdus sp. SCSIO 66989]